MTDGSKGVPPSARGPFARGLWELKGADNRMRLCGLPVSEATPNYATWVLFGSEEFLGLHGEICPLYDRSRRTHESNLLAMPELNYEGLIEGATPEEAGVGGDSGAHEAGLRRRREQLRMAGRMKRRCDLLWLCLLVPTLGARTMRRRAGGSDRGARRRATRTLLGPLSGLCRERGLRRPPPQRGTPAVLARARRAHPGPLLPASRE